MLVNYLSKATIVSLLILLSACASVQQAPQELDAAAKQFIPNENHAQVYVYRHQTFGAALSMPVTVDGKLAGTTGPKSYFKFNLPAGKHTITSQDDKSVLNLEVENGKIYYVWQQVKLGMVSGGSELQLVEEAEAQKAIAKCKLIASTL